MNDCSLEKSPMLKLLKHGSSRKRRPDDISGKADVLWEETGERTTRAAGVGVLARRERFAEITSGRSHSQQGLMTTCKDRLTKVTTVGSQRVWDWRMSPYERGRQGNAC
ncbi:MAG: hypothetical protein KZQ96_19750 [Candidatus Thiodiazotropha sp. (ex Lucinoma borealis)]|nr:hypothetical protein [Candidatus Thiodiazotropha sp. (ex Lucinoma borealis)]